MKRLALVGAVGAALVAAGIAVAHGNDNQTVTKVTASFAAQTVSGKIDTKTCTSGDGKSLTTTHASWTGAASGPADLTGAVKIDTNSTINTTDNVGVVNGHLTISPSGGGKTDLHFTGVYDNNAVAGLATGHSATHGIQVVANLSSGFTTSGGFTGGTIGGPTSGGSAVELGPGRCAPNKPVHENSHAEGTITALPGTSITVAGLTCAVPTGSLATKVATFHVGDRVHIECSLVSGTNTLTKIEGKH
jgi:hypothetical protein